MAWSPVLLGANTPQRFYRGGARILAFCDLAVPDEFDGGHDPAASHAGFSVLVTPYACGDLTLTGPVTAIRCRPDQDPSQTSGATAPASTIEQTEVRP